MKRDIIINGNLTTECSNTGRIQNLRTIRMKTEKAKGQLPAPKIDLLRSENKYSALESSDRLIVGGRLCGQMMLNGFY